MATSHRGRQLTSWLFLLCLSRIFQLFRYGVSSLPSNWYSGIFCSFSWNPLNLSSLIQNTSIFQIPIFTMLFSVSQFILLQLLSLWFNSVTLFSFVFCDVSVIFRHLLPIVFDVFSTRLCRSSFILNLQLPAFYFLARVSSA